MNNGTHEYVSDNEKQPYEIECVLCDTIYKPAVAPADIARWRMGEPVQFCFPYLDADDRELFISGTCGRCYDDLLEDRIDGHDV